ncbi:MAG: hypothetical protein K9K39_10770 [Desulfohalobiaceae bacterium]|nr:hypothetical protein [Desulfohalobiaceae bacterium]
MGRESLRLTAEGGLTTQTGGSLSSDPLACLGSCLTLDPDCTLRSFFRCIEAYPDLARLSPFFPSCLEEAARWPSEGCTTPRLRYLELMKRVELIGAPGERSLQIYCLFYAVGEEEAHDVKELAYGEILDQPLQLGPLRHVVFGDSMDSLDFATSYTLFEAVDTIIWHLSFQGAPHKCSL